MGIANLPFPEEGRNQQETINNLIDCVIKLRKELESLLDGNIDDDNVSSITTDKLVAGEAKIGTALIEDLVVGGNVTMGESATISWGQVDKIGAIASDIGARSDTWMPSSIDVGAIPSTYIDANGVFTPEVYATNLSVLKGKITALQIEDLYVGSNVSISPTASISWGNINKSGAVASEIGARASNWTPSAEETGAMPTATYIDAYGVYTGLIRAYNITGENFTAINNINIGNLTDNSVGKGIHFNSNAGNAASIVKSGGTISLSINSDRGLSLDVGEDYDVSISDGGLYASLDRRFDIHTWSNDDCLLGNYGAGDIQVYTTSGDVNVNCGGYLRLGSAFTDGISFFGNAPIAQQDFTYLADTSTLADVISKINWFAYKIGLFGLFYVHY